jgi:hypothetical protein
MDTIKAGLYDHVNECVEKSGGAGPTSTESNIRIDSEIKLKVDIYRITRLFCHLISFLRKKTIYI